MVSIILLDTKELAIKFKECKLKYSKISSTKLDHFDDSMAHAIWGGREVQWEVLDAMGSTRGISILWDPSLQSKVLVCKGSFSLSVVMKDVGTDTIWKC